MPKIREEIVCYDANTTVKTTLQFCPVCGSKKEIVYKDVPELKTVIIECCGGDKYSKYKERLNNN